MCWFVRILKGHGHDFCQILSFWFFLFCLQCIINDQPKFESQSKRLKWSGAHNYLLYKQGSFCLPFFVFALLQYTRKKILSWFSYLLICCKKKKFLAFPTFILGPKLEFSSFKQKHELNYVYKTKNFELCISLITRRLTQFWLTVENA